MKIEQPLEAVSTTQTSSTNSTDNSMQRPSASVEHFQYPSAFYDGFGLPSLPSLDYNYHTAGFDRSEFSPYSTAMGSLLGHQLPPNAIYSAWQRPLIPVSGDFDSTHRTYYDTLQGVTGPRVSSLELEKEQTTPVSDEAVHKKEGNATGSPARHRRAAKERTRDLQQVLGTAHRAGISKESKNVSVVATRYYTR
jgi:hypothetical protein